MRVAFTGGSGKAGKHAINYLINSGHKILNIPNTYKIIGMITAGVEDNIEIEKKSKTKIKKKLVHYEQFNK